MNFSSIFDINTIAFVLLDYPLSWIELIGTVFGLITVYLASRENILTWPTGLINVAFFFFLFYQVNLYSDMVLQVYFFIMSLYGWYYWKTKANQQAVTSLSHNWQKKYAIILVLTSAALGLLMSNIHNYFPTLFTTPAAFPFADAFTTVASIMATILLARKVLENWYLWIAVDIVSILLYSLKGIYLVAIEYFVFLIICIFGLIKWRKLL